jgi:bacterioferritin
MTNATRSVEHLQQALAMEMTAIHQYLLHAHVLDDMGLDILAERMREEMDEELGHAGRFIDRILFLEGDPKIVPARAPRRAGDLRDMFTADRDDEAAAIEFYAEAAKAADEDRDVGTRILFERILVDEEGHLDWLSRQIGLLERMGEPGYMARNMRAQTDGA